MKIVIGAADAHHRISAAHSITYKAGRTYDSVPKATADTLIKAGKAKPAKPTPEAKEI